MHHYRGERQLNMRRLGRRHQQRFSARSIVFNTAVTIAYIADGNDPKLKKCPVDASGNIGLCTEAIFFGAASYPEGMATTIRCDGMQIIAVGNNGGKLRLCTITATDDLACTINTISAARSTRSRAPQVRPGVSGRDCKEVVKSAMSMKPTS